MIGLRVIRDLRQRRGRVSRPNGKRLLGVIGCMRIGRPVRRGFIEGRVITAITVMAWGAGVSKRTTSGMGRLGLGKMRFGGRRRRGRGMFGGAGCVGREYKVGKRNGRKGAKAGEVIG